jgi:hypothetical protein
MCLATRDAGRDSVSAAVRPPLFSPRAAVYCGHRGRFMSTAGIVAVVAAGVAFAVLAAIVVWLLLMRDV